jgi:hypothetical protein
MLAREFFEEHGDIHVRFGLPPKRLIPLRTDEPFTKQLRMFTAPDGSEQKIEILGDGQQYVVDGIHPDTRKPYAWFDGELTTIKRENLPYVRREDAGRFLEAATKLLIEEHGFVLKSAANGDGGEFAFDKRTQTDPTSDAAASATGRFEPAPAFSHLDPDEILGEGIEENRWFDRLPEEQKDAALDHALEQIKTNSTLFELEEHGGDNDQWYRLVTSVARSGAPHAEDIFVKHASTATNADPENKLREYFRSCRKNPRGITVGTLLHKARELGADFDALIAQAPDYASDGAGAQPQPRPLPGLKLPLIVELGSRLWGPATHIASARINRRSSTNARARGSISRPTKAASSRI